MAPIFGRQSSLAITLTLIEQSGSAGEGVDFFCDLRVSRQDQFQEVGSNAYYGGVAYTLRMAR